MARTLICKIRGTNSFACRPYLTFLFRWMNRFHPGLLLKGCYVWRARWNLTPLRQQNRKSHWDHRLYRAFPNVWNKIENSQFSCWTDSPKGIEIWNPISTPHRVTDCCYSRNCTEMSWRALCIMEIAGPDPVTVVKDNFIGGSHVSNHRHRKKDPDK